MEQQTGQASLKEVSNNPADVALFFQQTVLDCYQSRDTDIILMVGRTNGSFHITSERLLASLVKRERSKGCVCEALQNRVCHFLRVFSDVSYTWRPHRCREHPQAISKSQPKSSSERIRSSINTPAAGIRPGQGAKPITDKRLAQGRSFSLSKKWLHY